MDFEQAWRRARGAIRELSRNMAIAHEEYVTKWPHDKALIKDVHRALQTLDWKMLAISFQLETLLGLAEMKDDASMMLLSSEQVSAEWAEMEHDIGLITLESVLFQFRAFLDMHMRYSLLVLGHKPQGKMGSKNFTKALQRLNTESESAKELLEYFEKRVWAEGCWGHLLRELRDKIAHQDRLYPRRSGYDEGIEVALTWLSVAGRPLEQLALDLSNGMVRLLQETTPIIMNRPWPV
ncbi:MAG: hypothetical protein HQ582_28950 [Planctomycetes bacterium]|nr:hypothetical protein [Planctomycetota bacterium]